MRNFTEEAITLDCAKKALIKYTDIEKNQDEMRVLDSILRRCYQMGWLPRAIDRIGGQFSVKNTDNDFNRYYMRVSANLLRDITGIWVREDTNRAEVIFIRRIWVQHLVNHRFTRMEIGAFCGRDHSSVSTALRKHREWLKIGCYTIEEMDKINALSDKLETFYWNEYEKYISALKE